ncbi:hypothetical protein JW826_02705 [Candidatus Woesearchaeota archaeon]|nr:hypothetical protein [Candidatus Woesearchaeota archaeon]
MDMSDFEEIMRNQNMMLRSVAQESETDSKIKLIDIINGLVTPKNKKVQKEAIILEATSEGMLESDVERLLDSLISDNIMIEPEPGFIKRG